MQAFVSTVMACFETNSVAMAAGGPATEAAIDSPAAMALAADAARAAEVFAEPTFFINGGVARGAATAQQLLLAACAAFTDAAAPEVCADVAADACAAGGAGAMACSSGDNLEFGRTSCQPLPGGAFACECGLPSCSDDKGI